MGSLGVMQKPECIYNVNEKGCTYCLHRETYVYTHKGSKNFHIVSKEQGESLTIVLCANTLENVIPPMILFKGCLLYTSRCV